ncbi:iron-sulfur cluster assembly scaffold protein [candidate division WOR-3 bacterium]|jgi:NifU-like protein involved in Fe-S cluster formation|nr:iron-sulfur cluster assembly scaffold protein [candidate division WOR-3 bacterium]
MDKLVREYFIKKIKKENFGQIEKADFISRGSICIETSGDVISIYIKKEGNTISDVKMECGPCDPAAIVATNIAVDILKNKKIDDIVNDRITLDEEFTTVIGGESKDGLTHFNKVIDQVKEMLKGEK